MLFRSNKAFNLLQLMPTIAVNAPASVSADASAIVDVAMTQGGQALDYTGELTVEMVNGYAPKTRVSIVNGRGHFKVMALGLEAGDVLRAKIGTRLVSGLAEASINVA